MSESSRVNYGRAQSLLLFAKLLESRDNASPLTLILDSLAQSAKQLVSIFMRKARASKTQVIYVSLETFRAPRLADLVIPAHKESLSHLQDNVRKALQANGQRRCIVVIDSLHILASDPSVNLATYLSSFISPTTSLVAVYHTDLPLEPPVSRQSSTASYAPHPLSMLKYLATTIITTHSLSHVLKQKVARDRALPIPIFGLGPLDAGQNEGTGVVQGLGSNDPRGTVVEMEYRRRSGRAVHGLYFLADVSHSENRNSGTGKPFPAIMLLDEHPAFRAQDDTAGENDGGDPDTTFKLGLTERQRRDRDGVVLPYFDAQREDGGVGEGGRILYDMGEEDDFDEEEDEI